MRLLICVAALLVAFPASAGPLILPAIGITAATIGATAFAVASAVVTMAITTGLSLVTRALFKQSAPTATGPAPNNRLDTRQSIRQPIAPHQVIYGRARVGGIFADMWVRNGNQTLYFPLILAGHECDAVGPVYLNDQLSTLDVYGNVVTGSYAGNAVIGVHLGGADQGASGLLLLEAAGRWTADHRLRGLTYLACQLFWDNTTGTGNPGNGTFQVSHLGAKLWQNGVPNVTAYVRGKKVYDPRTGTTAWSDNWALCVADYLCDPVYGLGVDYDTGIDEEALIAAANASDEEVTLAGGGTEKRYTINGAFKCDGSPDEILGLLLGAGHGKAIYDGERWIIQAGVYQTPTITITDDDMRGGSTLQTLMSARDAFNAVKGTAPIGHLMQPADFPAVISDTFRAADGGIEKFRDIELPFTDSAARCQRIAKIHLLKARQEIVETFKGKLSCWRVKAGDTVLRASPINGWTEKPFEVGSVKFAVDEDPEGNPVLGVDLVLLETAPEVYDWATDEESAVDPAPNTELPEIFNVLPPSNLRAVESLYDTRTGGGVKAKVTLTWDSSPDAFVKAGGSYQAEYRLSGASVWTRLPRTTALKIEIEDIDPGTYDFRVASINWADNASAYVSIVERPIAGLGALPSAPQNLSLIRNGNFAVLRWDFPAELDVQIGGTIVFKHAAQTTGASWEHGVTISEPLGAAMSVALLPLVAGTYMAKFVDASGNWSEDFAAFATGQDGALEFSGLVGGSQVEDPAFAGVKTGCVALGGVLKLGGAGLFSAIPLVSAVPSVFYYGGVRATGTYGWSQKVDLGSKKRHRLTVSKTTLVANVFDLLSERSGNVSTWPMFGGSVAGLEADAVTYGRFTDDDPNGVSPNWSDWARVDCGEFDCRGHELETELTSRDPSFDINVSALSALAEEVV
jgi:hypothetical protein